jgi:hypothetical protein
MSCEWETVALKKRITRIPDGLPVVAQDEVRVEVMNRMSGRDRKFGKC